MNNSIKQMLRTPLKTTLFFLLIILSAALCVVGLNLWLNASSNLKKADEVFVTIGTVTQKENTMLTETTWDAGLKDYIYTNSPVYDSYIPITALQLDGVEYISGPEQRPFYGGYVSDFIVSEPVSEDETYSSSPTIAVIEFVPVNNCIPSEPVEVEVVNVLYGDYDLQGRQIKLCDHFTEQPESMESGKTYIAFVNWNLINTDEHENLDEWEPEYAPYKIYSGQSDLWEEVYEGFYETTEGERWLNFVDAQKRFYESTVPVTPTQDTQLLYAFHSGEAAIVEGRDISQEEYDSGAKVCLISQSFAELNNISTGDTVNLGLYNANYDSTAVEIFGYGSFTIGGETTFLNSDGEPYDVFEEINYTVVGVYSYPNVSGLASGYELSPNEVIVPTNSISKSDESNIAATGPMQGKNTSFRIPNGSSEEFMEALSRITESSLLEIQFYDNGYEQVAAGLENLRIIAIVLFFVGLAAAAAVITFFLYFSVIKQRRRMAIERALGTTKRQCAQSLLAGVLLLTVVGSVSGAFIGTSLNRAVQDAVVSDTEYFSTAYSRGARSETTDEEFSIENSQTMLLPLLVAAGETALVCILALILISRNLNIAPIYLLGRKEDE